MRALVTFAIEMEVDDKEQVRTLAKQIRQGMTLNIIAHLERNGMEPAEVEELLTVFAPTITYPLPLSVREHDREHD